MVTKMLMEDLSTLLLMTVGGNKQNQHVRLQLQLKQTQDIKIDTYSSIVAGDMVGVHHGWRLVAVTGPQMPWLAFCLLTRRCHGRKPRRLVCLASV